MRSPRRPVRTQKEKPLKRSEKKSSKAEVKQADEVFWFGSIVESSDDAIIAQNLEGVISAWNAGAQRMFGYTAAEAIGQPITIIVSPTLRDEEKDFLRRERAGERIEHYETRRISKDGRKIDVSITVSPVRDAKGRIIGTSKIARDITERKRAEAVLRESEERFRLVANTAPVMIWMSDVDKLCSYFNQGWLEFTGRPLEAELGNGWAEGVHPDDLERGLDTYTKAFDQRAPLRMEYRLRRHDGEYRWIFDQGVPRFNVDGSFVGYIGSGVDVTESKLAKEALRKSDERFRLAAQAGKMFAYEWDATTDVVVRSGETAPTLGIDEARPFTGQQALAQVHPDDREGVLAAHAELSPEKSYLKITYRMVRPDGSAIWVERSSRAHFDDQGRMVRIVGMVADITERKLAERERLLANDRLRLAMEAGKAVGWDRDVKSGRDSLFGDLRSMFGIPSEVYDGRVEDFHRYLHPEDRRRVLEAIDNAMQSHEPYAAEFRLRWPDGTVRWLAAKGKFYYSRDGEPERMLGMAIDITDRKLTEEALRESEERFRLAAQAGRMYAFDWDVVTDVIVRSEESTRIFGLSGEPIRLTKRELLARVHPEDQKTFINSLAECTPESPNTQITYRLSRPDGSVIWLERTGHAFFDEQGRMVRMIGLVADITERRLTEEALSRVGGRLIEAHEEERTRIARELHDDICQRLALLVNDSVGLEKDLPDSTIKLRNRIHEYSKRVQEIAADVQAISHRLHSSKLRYLGILAAAKSFCQELSEQHRVEIDFTHTDIPRSLAEEISLCLFRVLQEALQNAVKYSGVRHFEVELRGASDGIHLTVRDVGLGFDPEAVMNKGGLGLVSMQERVNLVRGTFSIDSRPGRGTTVHARVPFILEDHSMTAAG